MPKAAVANGEGSFPAMSEGVVTAIFDNYSAWMYGRTVKYCVKAEN